jgi:hypothetical protein
VKYEIQMKAFAVLATVFVTVLHFTEFAGEMF